MYILFEIDSVWKFTSVNISPLKSSGKWILPGLFCPEPSASPSTHLNIKEIKIKDLPERGSGGISRRACAWLVRFPNPLWKFHGNWGTWLVPDPLYDGGGRLDRRKIRELDNAVEVVHSCTHFLSDDGFWNLVGNLRRSRQEMSSLSLLLEFPGWKPQKASNGFLYCPRNPRYPSSHLQRDGTPRACWSRRPSPWRWCPSPRSQRSPSWCSPCRPGCQGWSAPPPPDCLEQLRNSLIAQDQPLLQDERSKLIQVNISVPVGIHPSINLMSLENMSRKVSLGRSGSVKSEICSLF